MKPTFRMTCPNTGLNFCAVFNGEDRPTVYFYDTDYDFTEYGQFTGGGYFLETLLEDEEGLRRRGLCLDGGIPKWAIGGYAMEEVLDWAKGEAEKLGEVA